MRLLFIRHGQTPANVLGLLDTARPGPGLTALGMRQAAAIPHALAAEPIDLLFASTLVRTQLTAAPLGRLRGLDVEVRSGLREIEAGALEARSDDRSVRTYLETVFAWGSGALDVRMPGGVTGHDFFGRYNADLAEITTSGAEVAAVVSHGAAIRVWVAANAVNVPPAYSAETQLDNTGIVVVDGSFAEGWTLTRWADQPIGGPALVDVAADDPAGESIDEALAE
jgi:broad specificity phosphatase PhoE